MRHVFILAALLWVRMVLRLPPSAELADLVYPQQNGSVGMAKQAQCQDTGRKTLKKQRRKDISN